MTSTAIRHPWRIGDIALRAVVVAVIAFLAAPVVIAFVIAVNPTATIGVPHGFSLKWFGRVLQDDIWLSAYKSSILASLAASAVALVVGTLFSYAGVRRRFTGRRLLGTIAMSPLGMPRIIIGISLLFFLQPLGIVGSFYVLVLGFTVLTTPYVIRTVGAVFSVYDPRVEEAAMTLGADPIQTFLRITLPMISPGLISAAILAFVYSFGNLQVAIFLVGPGNETIPVQMFSMLEFRGDPSIAAVACINIVIVTVLILVANRIVGAKTLMQL
jgi:putative spermidine/putrescine transport system permease protein